MKPGYLACGGWIASATGVAATLRIADLLAEGPRSSTHLASVAGVAPVPLTCVMKVLVAAGLFAELPDGTFANTPDSETLRSDHPTSVRSWCMLAAGDDQRLFQQMGHTVRTGDPANELVLGGTLYAYLAKTPDAADIYDRAMEDLARPLACVLAAGRDLSQVKTVVDVGGGRGTIVRGLLRAVPHLTGICIDRPDVCDRARRDIEPELVGRLTYEPGDFVKSVPTGADLYIVKNVLHNWNDDSSIAILRTIATAMRSQTAARLLVIEPVVGGGMPGLFTALDNLVKVVIGEAGTTPRSADDLTRLVTIAGFTVHQTQALSSGHTLIEASVSGAFVDLGAGVQGLLHVSEMGWSRVTDPSSVVKVGEEITVRVLRIEADGERIALGLKQLMADPWVAAAASYEVGQVKTGRADAWAKSIAVGQTAPFEVLARFATGPSVLSSAQSTRAPLVGTSSRGNGFCPT